MINYIFPGTFDPITFGHISLAHKFLSIISKKDVLSLAVSSSQLKKPVLTFEERFALICQVLSNETLFQKKIFVEKIIGNTAEFIHKVRGICVRGIRNLEDLMYESYWPVSRSSKNPVEIFLLIPVLNENSQHISSSFFKSQFSELLLKNNRSHGNVYKALKNIAPLQTIDLFYQKYFSEKITIENKAQNTNYITISPKERISCMIADNNIVDYGQLEFINSSLNLSDKLIIFVPQIIQHERIKFDQRFNLLTSIVSDMNDQRIEIIECEELITFQEISILLKKHKITQFFFEMREYHTRNYNRLKNVFEQMTLLSKINIDLIIILQEKFRDVSQPLLFTIGYDDKESKIHRKQSMLNKYIPSASFDVLSDFVNQ